MSDDALTPEEIANLRSELARTRAERDQFAERVNSAEAGKRQAELQTLSVEERRLLAQEQALDNGITAAESEADALEAQIGSLQAEGKFVEAAKVTRQLATAQTKIESQRQSKEWVSGQREVAKGNRETHEKAPVPRAAAANASPRDSFDVNRLHPASKSWIAKHPEFLDDWRFHRKTTAAHADALAEGLEDNTPEFFAHIEKRLAQDGLLGGRQREDEMSADNPRSQPRGELNYDVEEPQGRAAGRGSMRESAPPSRSAGGFGGNGNGTRLPNLSSEEKEVADSLLNHLPPAERYTHHAENIRWSKAGPEERQAILAERRAARESNLSDHQAPRRAGRGN